MSVWQIGRNEVTEETQNWKNKLSSKETQIAAQQNEILKQAAELAELKANLNETLHKLNHEAARAVTLESTLGKCTEDLRNESLTAQNAAAALAGAHEKLKAKDLEVRELEATLVSISHKSETFNTRGAKLEKEKATLEARVRELEGDLRQLSSPVPTAATPARQRATRGRSSSASDTRIVTLEQELRDARVLLAQKEPELRCATAKLAQVQGDLLKVENDRLATEKRLQAEIRDLRVALQEKSEDVEYLKEQQGDSGREDELLKRIDEDEAKIAALEMLLKDASETKSLKDQLRRMEQKLLVESERVLDMEGRHIELVREKEEALDEVEDAQAQISKLSDALRQKETLIEGQHRAQPHPSEDDIERLLGAIERIRGERDDLRRDVEFLQSEAKFTEEALEARIASLTADLASDGDAQLQTEVHRLRQQLTDASQRQRVTLQEKNQEIRRIGLAAIASAVVIERLQSQAGLTAEEALRASTTSENALEDASRRLDNAELQIGAAGQSLDAMTRQRDELLSQLAVKEAELDTLRLAHQDTQDDLMRLDAQLGDMSRTLDDVEGERNGLNLQVTNLLKDLEDAQHEITEAETRYSALQFHQLSAMTTNEATLALHEQLTEQEERVLRRTELVGILQHDVGRLGTNLKLQEERLGEMTTELDAMVEDCAEARQARDAAIRRAEDLEVEAETLEARLEDGDAALCALVGVVVETVNRSRHALRHLRGSAPLEVPVPAAESIDWEARVSELDKKQQDLQLLVASMEASHRAETEGLNARLAEKDRLLSDNDLEGELARLKVKHVEEMGLLQGRLIETTSALDEAQARCEAAEADYRQALSDSTRTKQELEAAAGDAATQADGLRAELARIRDEHAAAVEQLTSAVSDAHRVQTAHQELGILQQRTVEELSQAREASENRLRELEDRVAELDAQLEAQSAECDALSRDADALRRQLQQDAEAHEQEVQEHNAALHDAQERRDRAEALAGDLKEELSVVAAERAEARSEVEALHEERTALQEEVTALQAEIQRALSLRRYLENQVKEKEQLTASLTTDLERVRAQHARAEKTGKAAEVNLSLQSAQHRREMSELQKQLTALQSQPDLSSVIADLEDRNNEMEELLKHKCAEIEENDDRALEMLKNNKKLTTKVESLTRKVQNLQAKLAAAKATSPNVPTVQAPEFRASPSLSALPPMRQRSNTLAAIPPVPSLPPFVPPSPMRNRVASGSALPRPKTPERRAIPQVFKAQTPERRVVPVPPSPSAPVLGQKRRAPDDFEDINVPTQGFTAESLPDENGTPRVRRVLNSIHSGFTPVRQSARAVPSPKRAVPARSSPYMSDVTNSPRAGDSAKSKPRSWLGKIRGTSQPRITHSRTGEL
ncbi:hypothetical protein DFH07DRAFT_529180 [Mycena maculata]|uniref:Uncharacterized protein n=1 Tax=Mycena maculata TaxID=230809 RepID=A0AAD7IX80_9AGAR|nr:hypothetical protein DFH07DRAFT_529180 [Mycena maculata]